MAKHYGDLPCVKLDNVIHLTISGNRCACGCPWHYHTPDRSGKFINIIWRSEEAITCNECLQALRQAQTLPF